jgi:biopolymer transport protein ExbD
MKRTRSRNGSNSGGITDPNMTPLIDVSLVLVVILMVATPLALQSGLAVSRAGTSGKNAAATRTQRIEIQIVSADSVIVDRDGVSSHRSSTWRWCW